MSNPARLVALSLTICLVGCLGSSEEQGTSAVTDPIRWVTPTKPVTNTVLAGSYEAPEDAGNQAVQLASLGACNYEFRWNDGTTSTGSWEAHPSWDPSSRSWNAGDGELHLQLGNQKQIFEYLAGSGWVVLIPKSPNATAMHGTNSWILLSTSSPYRPECAWYAEDLRCLAMDPPDARPASCTIQDSWPMLQPRFFSAVSTSRQLAVGGGRPQYEVAINIQARPDEMVAIACVQYAFPLDFENPVRELCNDPEVRYETSTTTTDPFVVTVTVVTIDGRRWTFPYEPLLY